MNGTRNQSGTMQLLGMMAGLMVAPVLTPALIWATVMANLPLALVIVQLLVLAAFSNWFSRRMIRHHEPIEDGNHDQTTRNPWSTEPSHG